MTTAEILEALRLALVADSALNAWCLSEFEKAPTVWLGMDEQNPPPEADYPLVAIVGVDQVRGDARGEIEWHVHLGAGILNSAFVSDGSSRTYPGLAQAETMRELSENALYRAQLVGPVNVDTTGEASSVSYHPLYVSYTTVVLSGLKTRRKGPP